MNFLKDSIKKLYFKYLLAAFGSALITSIYSVVDMAMVGQYQGPNGTAALAVVAPVWNIVYSLGLLMGIGGSVLFSMLRAEKEEFEKSNQYFTVAVIGALCLSLFSWLGLGLFEKTILKFFGANQILLDLSIIYLKPILFVLPLFLLNQMLAAFLRNDGNPTLATIGVLMGGLFNMFGDYFFVFTCDMGVFGAGLATAIGSLISFLILMSHFISKKNTLKFVKVENFYLKLKKIIVTGFSTFFIDVAMGILTILFNRQIMKYLGSNALAIYGPIIQISTFVQCCAYSVGQAAQPILSSNYGAKQFNRIRECLRYALYVSAAFSIFWFTVSVLFPNFFISLFMQANKEILAMAPSIVRVYAISFLMLPFNIFSTYYFQSVLKPKESFVVSVVRGCVLSGALILILPILFSGSAIWWTMPITELIVMLYAIRQMKKSICELN